jgi:K+-transporting ATPase ATPase C chain
MKNFIAELRISVIMIAALAVILCGAYPVAVLAVAQGIFPDKANGSIVLRDGTVIGSSLLAQPFTGPGYFHPRPSVAGEGYDTASSGASNLGPTSQKLIDTVRERVEQYRVENGLGPGVPIPADAVTASGSGLDPDISVKNALLQAPRVAKARGMSEAEMQEKVRSWVQGRDLGLLGEPRVTVLLLNLALDEAKGRQ